MQIELNKETFFVNSDEFTVLSHTHYENLKLYPQLAIFEREVGLIRDIINNQKDCKFINIGISHGGFVPIQVSKHLEKAFICHNSKDSHHENLLKNTNKLLCIDNLDILKDYDSSIKIIRLEHGVFMDFHNVNRCIILSYEDLILSNYREYLLSNSNLKIYVSKDLVSYFEDRFKCYLQGSSLDYDNLINLCMMVKNAGDGFKKILEENLPYIDRWTFLDTGSTDNTVSIIKEVLKNKNGKLYEEPFINFRESRNRCLQLAGTSCKYNIMIDDTYILRGDVRNFLTFIRSDQSADSYNIFVNSNDNIYGSNRILKSERNLKYIYLVHEIVQDYDNVIVQLPLDRVYIEDVSTDYMRKRTQERKKYDLDLLFQTLEEYPTAPRTLYYIARTYSTLEQWDKVYEYAMKRIQHPNEGYAEEVTDCYLICGNVAEKLGWSWDRCEELYLKCYDHDITRADPLYCIGMYYLHNDQPNKAYEYLKRGFKLGTPLTRTSNIRTNIYNELLPEALISLCYRLKDYKLGEEAAERYLKHNNNDTVMSYYKIFQLLNKNNASKHKSTKENIFCFVADGGFRQWSDNSITNEGVGDCETFVIELSRCIARGTNYKVYVFCNTDIEERYQGVKYKKLENYIKFINEHNVDICIISRFSEYIPVSLENNITNLYLVVHDLLPSGNIIPLNPRLKKIYCMSEWHKQYFLSFFPTLKDRTDVWQETAITELISILKNEDLKPELLKMNRQLSEKHDWMLFLAENFITNQVAQYYTPAIENINYLGMLNWSSDIPSGSKIIFENVLDRFKDKECNVLEIGTYAGTSIIGILNYLPKSMATVIDMWENYDENKLLQSIQENGVYESFLNNLQIANVTDRVTIKKGDSKDILIELLQSGYKYDFIHVNGSHKCLDCYSDMIISWEMLNVGGVLAIDDYLWMPEVNKDNNLNRPYHAVQHFMERYKSKYDLLSMGYRVFLLKL